VASQGGTHTAAAAAALDPFALEVGEEEVYEGWDEVDALY
jgi:hypothetical protein